MTTATILQAASRAVGRLDRQGGVFVRVPVSGQSEVQDVLRPLVNHQWTELHTHTTKRLAQLDDVLADWLTWRATLDAARAAVAAVASAPWTRPVEDPRWPTRRATIVATLRSRGVADAETVADEMGRLTLDMVASDLGAPLQRAASMLATSAEPLLDGRHAVLLLDVAASFHLVPARPGRVSLRPVTEATSSLDRAEAAFWAAASLGQTGAGGAALAATAEGLLPSVVEVAAHLAATRARRPTSSLADAVRAGDVLRRALTLAACGRAAQLTHEPERWQRAADLPVRRSPVVPSASAPPPVDGQRSTLLGVLREVTIRHRGPMSISTGRFTCGDHDVTLMTTHIKLDSGGLVPGAAAAVSGTWMLRHPDADGPVLFLRREQVAANANKDRDAWVLQRLRYAYVPVPHRMAVRTSIEPGRGIAGPLVFATFTSEPRGGR